MLPKAIYLFMQFLIQLFIYLFIFLVIFMSLHFFDTSLFLFVRSSCGYYGSCWLCHGSSALWPCHFFDGFSWNRSLFMYSQFHQSGQAPRAHSWNNCTLSRTWLDQTHHIKPSDLTSSWNMLANVLDHFIVCVCVFKGAHVWSWVPFKSEIYCTCW